MTRPASTTESYDDVPLSALLQAARSTYSHAVDAGLARIGCDDLSATGSYIISAMHWSGASLKAVIRWMGVSKQAISQTVDTLVVRSYLKRSHNPSDRRRVDLSLTDRGKEAAKVARSAIERIDRELLDRVGAQRVDDTRVTLIALLEMDRKAREPHSLRTPES